MAEWTVPPAAVPDHADQPVHLDRRILRSTRAEATAPPAKATQRPDQARQPTFTLARRTNNELILFDEGASESWIVYPPRSAYEFLAVRRRSPSTTIVEHHPWAPSLAPIDHVLDARDGCLEHGLQCRAQLAITAAVRVDYDPFV